MTTETIDYNAIGQAAAEHDDLTKQSAGGSFERVIPEEGKTMLRLRRYLELGVHMTKGQYAKPNLKCLLEFELLAPKHMIKYQDADGKDQERPNSISIWINRPVGKGIASKSNYAKLFNAMNTSGKYTHFSQMVGNAKWLAEVFHGDSGDPKKPYVNLDNKDRVWSFANPVVENPATGTVEDLPVPELYGDKQVFLYENAGLTDDQYLSLWDSIYIEGEHDAEDDKPAKSKNWIQDMIREGIDFDQSRLARLIGGEGTDQLEAAIEEATEVPAEPVQEEANTEPEPVQEAQSANDDADDPLVALGLA